MYTDDRHVGDLFLSAVDTADVTVDSIGEVLCAVDSIGDDGDSDGGAELLLTMTTMMNRLTLLTMTLSS